MIQIIDYGVGNLKSIANIIKHQGGESVIISSPNDWDKNSKAILPGVGSFDHGMLELEKRGWKEALPDLIIKEKTPILGICLGMQLMCNSSEEGQLPGLGWIDAEVKEFNFKNTPFDNLKVPHMGWNMVNREKEDPLTISKYDEQRFYFVHSYYVKCNDEKDIAYSTEYGIKFTSGFIKDNIYGAQFHPEKSHKFGMELIHNFINL